MTQTCPLTPYQNKTSPYSEKASVFTKKESPFSQKVSQFIKRESPYGDKYFCDFARLLMEDGYFLLLDDGAKIILE